MTHQAKHSPRAAYRLEQGQRVLESACLATAFPKLKSLTVDLALYDPQGLVMGELHCEGWRNRAVIGTQQCRNLLRYKLTLRF